jgi:ATP-dependent Lhr-like helicase
VFTISSCELTREEIRKRCISDEVAESTARLLRSWRALEISVAGEKRLIAVEDAARYRDALGVPLPPGLPIAFQQPAPEALIDLIRRFARTHGPFTTQAAATRFALPPEGVEGVLHKLVQIGRVVEGGFRPGGVHREWCEEEVLRTIRRKSLAKLRKEVEPVEQRTLARLFTRWQGTVQPRRGLDALLDTIETLQGSPLPASILETEILPARVTGYKSSDLDLLMAAGEVVWVGLEPLGERDGRVGLYLAEKLAEQWPPRPIPELTEKESAVVDYLKARGASFFQDLHDGLGGGYPGETLEALWGLVWKGLITNDGMAALRAYSDRPSSTGRPARRVHKQGSQANFRSRRTTPPTGQGRWALQTAAFDLSHSPTEWSHAMAHQLLQRYGVVFRETAHAENLPGGFSSIYDVLKAMEESGRIRRGYFAADLGATQFAMPAAVDLLRSLRVKHDNEKSELLQLAATDPANPYGALMRWPPAPDASSSLTRSVGARVILCDGALVAYIRRGNPNLQVFLPDEEPQRSQVARSLAEFFVSRVQEKSEEGDSRSGMMITTVNGTPVAEHPIAKFLLDAGFAAAPMGFNVRRMLPSLPHSREVRPNA